MADRSIKITRGQIDDVIVKVHGFYYPVYFIVPDIERSHTSLDTPIILGCPFLATIDAHIGCREGNLKISFGDMSLDLNIINSCQSKKEMEDVNVVDACVDEYFENEFEHENAYYANFDTSFDTFQEYDTAEAFHVQDS